MGDATVGELAGAVEDLAGRFALQPLLQRILRRAVGLLGGAAGSICTVDELAGTYRKEADLGVLCRQGSVFPLGEGSTGAVVARRGPVVFDRYADVPGGHLAPAERARMLATVAVPIEWAGAIIGACVVFSADPAKRWQDTDVRLLQLFAGHAAVALTNARLHAEAQQRAQSAAIESERERVLLDVHDTLVRTLGTALERISRLEDDARVLAVPGADEHLAAVAHATRLALAETRRSVLDRPGGITARALDDAVRQELAWVRATTRLQTDLVVTGDPGAIVDSVARPALQAVQEALANVITHSGATQVRIGLLCGATVTTVLVSDNGRGFEIGAAAHGGIDRLVAAVERAGGTVGVETATSWGTRVRIELPHPDGADRATTAGPASIYPVDAAPVRVLVVDPRALVRAGLRRALERVEPDAVVVGEAEHAEQALARVVALDPDLVLTAAGQADRLAQDAPALRLLVLCDGALAADDAQRFARRGHATIGLDAEPADLVRTVLAVAAEPARGVEPATGPDQHADAGAPLTVREQQVVDLVSRGMPDKQVARVLAISVKTVQKHVGSALRKTGLPNRTALAASLARR